MNGAEWFAGQGLHNVPDANGACNFHRRDGGRAPMYGLFTDRARRRSLCDECRAERDAWLSSGVCR